MQVFSTAFVCACARLYADIKAKKIHRVVGFMTTTRIKAMLLVVSLVLATLVNALSITDEANIYTARGLAKGIKGDLNGARADFNAAIKIDPKLAAAYDGRAGVEFSEGNLEAAAADYNRALKLDSTLASPYVGLGNIKQWKGDMDGAIADYNRAIELNSKLANAYVGRASAKVFRAGEAKAYASRGLTKLIKGDQKGAIADFNSAISLDPKVARPYGMRAEIELTRGDLGAAAADYSRALRLDPDNGAAYSGRAEVKYRKGDLDGAIADYNRAIELNSNLASTQFVRANPKPYRGEEARVYISRGDVNLLKGDLDAAIADYNQALKVDPTFVGAYGSRGSANLLAHEWTAALRDYGRFGESSKRDQDYSHLYIWLVQSRCGDRKVANKELVAYFNTTDGRWTSKIASFLLGNLSEADFIAAAASSDAKTDRGQHCELWFYAGMKELLAGNKPAAADYFKKCLATQQVTFYEYRLAKGELKALEH